VTLPDRGQAPEIDHHDAAPQIGGGDRSAGWQGELERHGGFAHLVAGDEGLGERRSQGCEKAENPEERESRTSGVRSESERDRAGSGAAAAEVGLAARRRAAAVPTAANARPRRGRSQSWVARPAV
jgi:hypothetical protein